MLISAVVIGLILMSTASTVSEIQKTNIDADRTLHDINTIKSEAEETDLSDSTERANFKEMVERFPNYNIRTEYNKSSDCLNITLKKKGMQQKIECISQDNLQSFNVILRLTNAEDFINYGNFYGTSVSRSDNSGNLGIGYLNGSKSGTIITTSNKNEISTQAEFGTGTFKGSSADRQNNSGNLGIGYLNGSNPSSTSLEDDLSGYWRMDGDTSIGASLGSTDTIVDSFEDGNFNEYKRTKSGTFDIVSSPTSDGSDALESKSGQGGTDFVASESGLNAYPSAGDTFTFDWRPASLDSRHELLFAVQDTSTWGAILDDHYSLGFDAGSDELVFRRNENGNYNYLHTETNVGFTAGEWHTVEVDWGTGGSFTITVYDNSETQLAQFDYTDSGFSSGGIGFWNPSDAASSQYFDNIRIKGAGGGNPDTYDFSGYGNDAASEGVSSGATGVFGTDAFDFTGSSNYVEVPSVYPTVDEFTTSAWIYPTSVSGSKAIFSKGKYDGGYTDTAFYTKIQSGAIQFIVTPDGSSNTGISSAGTINNNQWQHVVSQYNGTHLNVFIDGVLAEKFSYDSGIHDSSLNEVIGGLHSSSGISDSFEGRIDEVRFYNRSLSEKEVEDLYFNGENGVFNGNYTSKKIDTSSQQSWNNLTVDVTGLSADTDLDAEFRALESDGSLEDSQLIDLQNNLNNYSLSVSDSEDAEVKFYGTSTSETNSWNINKFKIFRQTQSISTDNDLKGYWRLDRSVSGNGGTVLDYSGSGYHGTTSYGVTSGQTGLFGTNSVRFDGNNDEINLPDSSRPEGTNNFTISTWFKLDQLPSNAGQSMTIFGGYSFGGDSCQCGVSLSAYSGNNQLYFDIYDSDQRASAVSDNALKAGEWYHVIATWNGTGSSAGQQLWINGRKNDTGNEALDSGIDWSGWNNWRLGYGTNRFDGKIDEFQVYKRSLSESEIEQKYFKGNNDIYEGKYEVNNVNIPSGKKVSKIEVDSTKYSTPTIEFTVEHSSGGTDSFTINQNGDIRKNHTVSISDTGGDIDITARIKSSDVEVSSIIEEIKVWVGE